jgi:hypothetical protein
VSERLSRGEIISLIAGIPAAVAVTGAAASAADTDAAKTQKKNLGYVDKSTKAGQECDDCRFYKAVDKTSGTCQLIPGGTVQAGGWCKSWVKKS